MVYEAQSLQQALDRPMPRADATAARLAATRAGGMAAELRRLQAALSGSLGRAAGWSGTAELAFQDSLDAELGRFPPAVRRFEGYAAVLAGYAGELELLGPRLAAARSRLAGDPLAGVAEFDRCWQQWDATRTRCVAGLAVAGEVDADRHRHGWSALLGDVRHALPHPGLAELSHALGDLSQALVVAGVVLALVCPPAAGAVWAALAVVAVCQLAVDATRRGRGEQVGWAQLGWDAAAVLPVGRLGKLAEFGSAAEASAAIERLAPELRSSRIVPGGGLAAHEGTATHRGHTLLKHVGKSPKQLAKRFKNEPGLNFSSSFSDRATAEAAIAKTLDENRRTIADWLSGPEKPLTLHGAFDEIVGRSVGRDGRALRTGRLRVILRSEGTDLGFYIRTAYPTP
jgi:Bacterial CdiA-CT RNAse A domain